MFLLAKTGGILYDRGGKPGTHWPEFWNRVRVSDYPIPAINH